MSSVTIGMTTKGINSTSRVMSGGVSLDCRLKEPCGLHDPVFIVKGLSKSYNNYNFCTWRGRYYWVNEIVFLTNDIQEVHCSLDPLATFKGAIDDTNAYIQYGDVGNWNKYIDDARLNPELEDSDFSDAYPFEMLDTFSSSGVVVLRYMDCGNGGGVKTVSMTGNSFANMLENLYNAISPSATIGELNQAFGGSGSWRDNILACRWLPLSIDTTGLSAIRLGGITCTVTCYPYTNTVPIYTYDGDIDLSGYWAAMKSDYPFLLNNRWTQIQITTPFGHTTIPIDYLLNQTKLYYRTAVNCATGEITIKFSERTNGDGYCYAIFSGILGVDLMGYIGNGNGFRSGLSNALRAGAQIGVAAASAGMSIGAAEAGLATAQANMDFADKWGDAGQYRSASTALSQAKQNVRMTALNAGIGAITQALPTGIGHSGCSGSAGGGAEVLHCTSPIGQCIFAIKVLRPLLKNGYDDFCNEYGYPVNYFKRIGDISGYCKCSGAFVRNIPGASPQDISNINTFLNNGIIVEA